MKLHFCVDGEPQSQLRPRFSRVGNIVVTRDVKKCKDQKAYVMFVATNEARRQGWTFSKAPLAVRISCYLGIPSSCSKKRAQRMLANEIRPTKKPDVDNLVKLILDALSGTIYDDDKNIVSLTVSKRFSDRPRTEVKVVEVGGELYAK